MMKILLIDNYDSFTHNLKQILSKFNLEVEVSRNDQIDLSKLDIYDGFVLSPGPGVPDNAGDLKRIIHQCYKSKPILGICLGMQAIAEVLDCRLKLMDDPIHGRSTEITHFNAPLFLGVPEKFQAGRYHSWVIDERSINNSLRVISKDDQQRIMGIKVQGYPVYGLQFHPQSIMTEHGELMVSNFLNQIKQQ